MLENNTVFLKEIESTLPLFYNAVVVSADPLASGGHFLNLELSIVLASVIYAKRVSETRERFKSDDAPHFVVFVVSLLASFACLYTGLFRLLCVSFRALFARQM